MLIVKALNCGDNLEYPRKLVIGCSVQDLVPFLKALGISRFDFCSLFVSCSLLIPSVFLSVISGLFQGSDRLAG